MAKSKRKSGSSSDISRWETELAQAHVAEDDWKIFIAFVVPNQIEDVHHCSILSESISTGLRKRFSTIEYESLLKEVKELAHGKVGKVKMSKPPPFFEIVDSIKVLLEQGEDVPPHLLAKLLKFKLLMIKQKDLERREDERKAAEAAAKQAKQEERSRSNVGSSPGKRSKSQSPGRKKGKRDDAPPSPKKDTKLKRRGELEDTFKTIDDEPDGPDDPNHYVIINSIYEPRVFQQLIDLGVSIDAVIKVKSESYNNKGEQELDEMGEDEETEETDKEANEAAIEEEKKKEIIIKHRLHNFWTDSETIIQSAASGTKIKDIANLSFVIKDDVVPDGNIKDLEQDRKTEYGARLFEYTANQCYDLLDSRKRYKRYINNLKLTHIPSLQDAKALSKSAALASSVASVSGGLETALGARQFNVPATDMRYYNHLMDQVPCESHSVPLLLDSLLRQVEATVDQKDPMDEPQVSREDLLDNKLGQYLDAKLELLGIKTPTAKGNNLQEGKPNQPVVIHHGDERTQRTHHLSKMADVCPTNAEEKIYELHPIASFMEILSNTDHDRRPVLTRKQQLAHCCNMGGKLSQFDKTMALMSLEVLPLKHVDADGEVSHPLDEGIPVHIGWDDPYAIKPNFKDNFFGENPDIARVDEEIRDLKSLRNLSEYQYSEYFDSKTFLQILDQAVQLRPYIDMYYHNGLSSLLLVLHNPKSDQLKNRKSWDTWLHSNTGFRNYLEHVAEEIEDWQKEEDMKEEIRNRPVTPQSPPREPTPVPIKTGSSQKLITRAEMLEMKEAEDDKSKKKSRKSRAQSRSPGKRPPSDAKKMHSPDKREKTSPAMKRTPSARKTASRAGTARKSLKSHQEKKPEPEETHEPQIEEEAEKVYPFHGYDVGDELVHVSGETSYLFPGDGGLIKVETSRYINGNASMRTVVYKNDNVLILNFKNPIQQGDEEVIRVENIEPVVDAQPLKGEDADQDVQEEETAEENEFMQLLSKIPPLPELSKPCCEESYLTVSCKDGMQIGIDGRTSKQLQSQLCKSASTVSDAKNAALLPISGVANNPANAKGSSPKGKRNKEDEIKKQEELERMHEKETREKIENAIGGVYDMRRAHLSTNNMSVACPDGLQLTFLHNEIRNGEPCKVLNVRQEYLMQGSGKHSCEEARMKTVMEEKSRIITANGAVIKYLRDGTVEVLFADGSLSTCRSYDAHHVSFGCKVAESSLSANTDTVTMVASDVSASIKKPGKPVHEAVNEPADHTCPEWVLVNSSGEQYRRISSSDEVKLQDLIVSRAVCPKTGQVVETREDGVIKVKRPEGTTIVEHNDGTRITTFFVNIAVGTDSETGEEEMSQNSPSEYVKVECIGYSTVLVNKENSEIKTIFGNGSTITASLHGEYKVTKPDSSVIFVNEKGETLFVPKNTIPDITSYEVGNLASLFNHIEENGPPAGVYRVKPSAMNCLSTVDDLGNSFSVSSSGEHTTERGHMTSVEKDSLPARYFMLHKDGSGEELLRYDDISSHLEEAEKDPTVAVLKSADNEENTFSGITILRPFQGTNGDIWLMNKEEREIIPPDLKERDFKTIPAREVKSAGPKFGSNAGVAFQVATKPLPEQPRPLRTCPNVLEMRYISKFSGITVAERRRMIEGIEKYRKFIKEQLEIEKGLLPNDPRNDEEKEMAQELLRKFNELKIKEAGLEAEKVKPMVSTDGAPTEYLEATEVPPSPPPERAKPQRPLKEWEKDRIEIAELKYSKEYLRSGAVPPYFDTEEGQRFLYATKGNSDVERLAGDLAKETVHPSYRPNSATSSDSNAMTPDPSSMSNPSGEFYVGRKQNQLSYRQESVDVFDASSRVSLMDSKLSLSRPGNPTPAEAINGDSGLGIHRESQSRSRPYNPTPSHATKNSSLFVNNSMQGSINELPESKEKQHEYLQQESLLQNTLKKQQLQEAGSSLDDFSSHAYFSSTNKEFIAGSLSATETSPRYSGLNFTVTGVPRKEAVKLPTSIQGSKPGALPNQKFKDVEEPVRRQVKTASVAGTVIPDSTSKLRGFQLFPDYINFGVLKEGLTYSYTVMLKNVGIDNCRFKVKQPPPSTGLRVVYVPGPVAAGMATRLDIEIFAVAVGVEGSSGVGSISHHIELITETDALYLPVTATILTSHEYDNRSDTSPRGGPSSNALLLGNRPSSREAITRPRRD